MAADAAASPQQPSNASAQVSPLVHHLQQLQQLLQGQQGDAGRSFVSPSAADAHLSTLRSTAAALKQQQHQQLSVAAPEHSTAQLQACRAAAGCCEALAQLLLQPPTHLYCGLGGTPSTPAEGLELAGEQQQLVAAAQLQLLVLLVGLFDSLDLLTADTEEQQAAAAAAADEPRQRNKPHHFQGIVEIEELPAEPHLPAQQQLQRQLQQQGVQLLLVAALYAPDSSCTSSSGGGGGGPSHCTLDQFCDSIVQQGLQLASPWSGQQCQQQAQHLLQQLTAVVSVPTSGSGSRSNACEKGQVAALAPSSCQAGSTQQQQQQQQLLCGVLPLLLDALRDTLLAQHRHRKLNEKGDMVSYTGPSTFQRCLAARQLSWLVQQLQPPALTAPDTLGLLLPLVLAVADDPSPSVRQYGHAALGWIGYSSSSSSSSRGSSSSGGSGGGLQWQGGLLREEARRLVVGCEESCWPTAMPAATSLIMALDGSVQRSLSCHSLLLELLTEAERSAHKRQPRLVFMACVARLVPLLRLYVVRHLAALMPLLLEWVHAYDEDSSVVALQLLGQLVRQAWPRMGVHAGVVRQHVGEVLAQERVEQGQRRPQQQQQHEGGHEEDEGGGVGSRRFVAAQQLLQLLERV